MTLAIPSYHKALPTQKRDLVLATGTYGPPAFFSASPSADDVYHPPVRLAELTTAELDCLQADLRAFFVDVSGEVLSLTESIDAERERRA
jgi:hypothetical protein